MEERSLSILAERAKSVNSTACRHEGPREGADVGARGHSSNGGVRFPLGAATWTSSASWPAPGRTRWYPRPDESEPLHETGRAPRGDAVPHARDVALLRRVRRPSRDARRLRARKARAVRPAARLDRRSRAPTAALLRGRDPWSRNGPGAGGDHRRRRPRRAHARGAERTSGRRAGGHPREGRGDRSGRAPRVPRPGTLLFGTALSYWGV